MREYSRAIIALQKALLDHANFVAMGIVPADIERAVDPEQESDLLY